MRTTRHATTSPARSVRAILAVLLPLVAGAYAAAPRDTTRLASTTQAERVVPNDNRVPAGVQHGDTLTLRLVLRTAEWFPMADSGPSMIVAALAEEGKAPTIPAPLIRVRAGTIVDVTVRHELPSTWSTAQAYGLEAPPQRDPQPVAVRSGETLHRRFVAGTPGTYLYSIAPRDSAPRDLHDASNGALIIDPPSGSPPDRIFVINGWTAPADSTHYNVALAFNGRLWPYTETLTEQAGDTVRWRFVNATEDIHPLHLHGHYFQVTSLGTGSADSLIAPAQRRLAVTQPLYEYQTMTLSWVPRIVGNWLFHCHLTFHVDPEYTGLGVPNAPELEATHHAQGAEHMTGLVMGIKVTPRAGERPVTRGRADTYRLLVQEGKRRGRSPHARGFVLQRGDAPAADSIEVPGTTLVFPRGRPVDINVVNHLRDAASIHWHGLELESFSDGAPGWSGTGPRIAREIAPGDSFTARLTLRRAGTFMYHTHVNDMEQLTSGLYGALIVLEPGQRFDPAHDHVYVGSWDGREDPPHYLVNGDSVTGPELQWRVGERHRFRLIGIGVVSGGRFALRKDSTLQQWRLMAKDGADIPTGPLGPADQRVLAGETFDFEWTPRLPGTYVLSAGAAPGVPPWTQRIVVR